MNEINRWRKWSETMLSVVLNCVEEVLESNKDKNHTVQVMLQYILYMYMDICVYVYLYMNKLKH